MLNFFMEGGIGFMSVLTVLLVAIFFAAWKAPRWVKEIGIFALALSFLAFLFGLLQVFSALQQMAIGRESVSGIFDLISPGVLFGGLKVNMIVLIYGIIIFLISLVVRIVLKPRL